MRGAKCGGTLAGVVQSNLDSLRSMLIQRTGNEDDALDLLQDTYLRCAEIKPGAVIDNPRSYVWRLALNLVIDFQRSEARRRRLFLLDETAVRTATAPGSSPEDTAAALTYLKAFQRTVEGLPRDSRRAFVLSRRDGLTYEEIAREMGVSINMVKKHIKRAIAVLRLHLDA